MNKNKKESPTTYSATERAPIEVWRMILLMAVQSQLLPRDGDDFVDGTILFMSGCHSQYRHQKIETLRCRLRLVCRTWNAILEDRGVHYSFLQRGTLYAIPSSHKRNRDVWRIEVPHFCSPYNYSCVERYTPPSPNVFKGITSDTVNPLGHTGPVEYLQLGADAGLEPEFRTLVDIIGTNSRLRALEIVLHGFPPLQLDLLLNNSSLSRITHLSIRGIGVKKEQEITPRSFPAVCVLFIMIPNYPPQDSILEWDFPSLTDLHILRAENRSLFHGLDRFLEKHSKQITGLNIQYGHTGQHISSIPYPIDAAFWEWFPNLRLFGPGLASLNHEALPPPSGSLESLVVLGFQPRYESFDWSHFDRYIDPLLSVCRRWRIEQIIILSSWEDMGSGSLRVAKDGMSRLSSSLWSERFFQEATASGIRIFDIDRVPITNLEGTAFLQRLHKPPPRSGGV